MTDLFSHLSTDQLKQMRSSLQEAMHVVPERIAKDIAAASVIIDELIEMKKCAVSHDNCSGDTLVCLIDFDAAQRTTEANKTI